MSENGYTRITLRIPDSLHAKLTDEASRTSKSMNAEIIARLEASFEAGAIVGRGDSGSEVAIAHSLLQSSNRMLDASMYYLKEMADLIPTDHPDAGLVARIREFAEVMGSKNLIETAETLSKMVEIGIKAGAIDPNTGKPKKPKEK